MTGVNGDYYLNVTTGDVFQKLSGTWNKIGNIKGPSSPINAQIGYFVCPSIIGNYSVTGLWFKPKVIEFFICKNVGLEMRIVEAHGFADAKGNQNVSTWSAIPMSNVGIWADEKFNVCLYCINTSGATQLLGTLVSMDNDGFTVNFTVVNNQVNIRWKAIG